MKNPHLEELGLFLRARRAELDPADLGLSASHSGARRVTGLRREEIASAVAISHDYYTRIEQGRLAPSEPVLDAIADLLRLDRDQRTYLEGLARQADRRTPPRPRTRPVRPQLQRLLDQLTESPAFISNQYLDILAWNPLAGALLAGLDDMTPHKRNYIWMVFTDPRVQALYDDWHPQAKAGVAVLRMQAVENPHDPRLAALVGELSVRSTLFRQWWADRHVARPEFGSKTIRHPDLGDFDLDWDTFTYAGNPDQTLMIWSAEPGSPTHDKLRILSSWNAPVSTRDTSSPKH